MTTMTLHTAKQRAFRAIAKAGIREFAVRHLPWDAEDTHLEINNTHTVPGITFVYKMKKSEIRGHCPWDSLHQPHHYSYVYAVIPE